MYFREAYFHLALHSAHWDFGSCHAWYRKRASMDRRQRREENAGLRRTMGDEICGKMCHQLLSAGIDVTHCEVSQN